MILPEDFDSTLNKIQRYNIMEESPDKIRARLDLAIKGVASTEGVATIDLGVRDWAEKTIQQFHAAIHKEICDSEKKCLNDKYQRMMESALSPDGVKSVAAVVLGIISKINPAFAVSSVGIYLAVWLLKVGLNHWCSLSINEGK